MTQIQIRPAVSTDLQSIVDLLADDPLGSGRETPKDLAPYRRAFAQIDADPQQHLVVAASAGEVIGTLQLTIIPGLARTAMTRGMIEGVRSHRAYRRLGVGKALIEWAVARSREHHCGLVQLSSDMSRADAHRFYEGLGFVHSHAGFKLQLS